MLCTQSILKPIVKLASHHSQRTADQKADSAIAVTGQCFALQNAQELPAACQLPAFKNCTAARTKRQMQADNATHHYSTLLDSTNTLASTLWHSAVSHCCSVAVVTAHPQQTPFHIAFSSNHFCVSAALQHSNQAPTYSRAASQQEEGTRDFPAPITR
jgi:hypothetical protein